MEMNKREFMRLGAAAGAALALPAWAQGKPLFETLNMFVPAAPGGGWDGTARAIERAAKAAGLVGNMPFENVAGAGGMVGLPRFVNQRKGQGNSLLVGGSVMVGAAIANKSPVTMRNVTPIARLTEEAGVVAVPAAGKIKTWQELEAASRPTPRPSRWRVAAPAVPTMCCSASSSVPWAATRARPHMWPSPVVDRPMRPCWVLRWWPASRATRSSRSRSRPVA